MRLFIIDTLGGDKISSRGSRIPDRSSDLLHCAERGGAHQAVSVIQGGPN